MKKESSIFSATFWRNALGQIRHTKTLAGAGLLSAIGIALKAFTIPLTPVTRISFVFVCLGIGGYLFGPFVAGFIAVVVDLIGFFISPTGGPYMPIFTLIAFLGGFIYGCFLYQKPLKIYRTFCAQLTYTLIINFILNPFFLNLYYGKGFWVLFVARIPTNLIMLPLGTFLLYFLQKALQNKNLSTAH